MTQTFKSRCQAVWPAGLRDRRAPPAGRIALARAAAGLVAAALPWVANGARNAIAQAGGTPAVACEVLAERQGPRYAIRGLITASADVSGSYRLDAALAGGTNSSRTSQSAGFAASPKAPASVGTVALASPGPGSIEVLLTVAWPGGSTECRRSLSLN